MSRRKEFDGLWTKPARHMKLLLLLLVPPAFGLVVFNLVRVQAQFVSGDPGPRMGAAGAGGPLASVSGDATLLSLFNDGQADFMQVDSVLGTIAGEPGAGLGPHFNSNSCGSCHAQPATGGTSPSTNPQVAVATLDGATNSVPFFITIDGPVREARFPFVLANGRKSKRVDGSVHDLFTIKGRTDATNTSGVYSSSQTCQVMADDFNNANSAGDIIFRIPTPLFGAGLIDSIPDDVLTDSFESTASLRSSLGVSGHFNVNGNDGSNLAGFPPGLPNGISRFGWKAQNRSLQVFAGEAYNVEMGVTNELFPSERTNDIENCMFNPTPEDHLNFNQ